MEDHRNPKSTAAIAGHPLHPMLIPLPITLFLGALFCDLAYVFDGGWGWSAAAQWMLGAGLIAAALAALTGFADFFGDRKVRAVRITWLHMIGNVMVVALEAINFFLRTGDAAEAIVPIGLTLSLIASGILAFTGWLGGEMVYRHRIGVHERDTLSGDNRSY